MKPSIQISLFCGIALCCLTTTSPSKAQLPSDARPTVNRVIRGNRTAKSLLSPTDVQGRWSYISRQTWVLNPCSSSDFFMITRRGGLPPSPVEVLSSDTVWEDLRNFHPMPIQVANQSGRVTTLPLPTPPQVVPLVEAQVWAFNDRGEVVLTSVDDSPAPLGDRFLSCR